MIAVSAHQPRERQWQPVCYADRKLSRCEVHHAVALGARQHRRGGFEGSEVGDNTQEDIVKTQGEKMHTTDENSETSNQAAGLAGDGALDQEAITILAYYYWEARGCPHDSPQEDWFRAESDLRNRISAAATA
jgi:Protein of unknown function (DUF2934)